MGAITLIGRESETGITIHPPGGSPVKSSGGMLYDMITLRAMSDAATRDARLVGGGHDLRARLKRIRERYDADYPANLTPEPFRDPEFWRKPGAFIGDMECKAYEGQNDDYYVVNSIFMPKGTHLGIFDAPKAKHAAEKPHVFIRVERPGIVLQVVLHEEGDANHSVYLIGGGREREPAREGHDFVYVGPQKPGRVGGKVSRVLIYGHAFTAQAPAASAGKTLDTLERHLLASTSFRDRQPPMAMGFEQRWACTWRNTNGNNYRWYRPSWAAVGPDLITAVTRFDHIKGADRDDHAVVAYLFDTTGKHLATHTALHPASGVAGDINQATAIVSDVAAGVGGASALIPGGVGAAVGAVATATQVASAIIGTTAELVANAAKTGGFVALLDEARLKGMRVLDAAARTRDAVKVGWEDRAANVVAVCFVEMLRALFLDYPNKSGRAFEFRAAEANAALSEYAGRELVKFVEGDDEHNYRIYAPACEVADGEVHMIAKIDHIRGGGNNDDHASIRWTFSPRTLTVTHWSCAIDYGETMIGSAIASYTINIASGAVGLKGGIPAFKGKFSSSLSTMRTVDVARGFRAVGRVAGKRNAIKMYADGVAPSLGNAIVNEAANRYVAHKYSEFRDLPGSKRPHFSVAIEAIQRQITHAGALVTAALGLAEKQEAERVAAAAERRRAHIQATRESLVHTVSLASINAYNVLWEYNRKDRIRRAREASERAREHERLYRPEWVAQLELDERWDEALARAQRLSGRAPVNGASELEFCRAFQWLQAEGYRYYPVDGALARRAAVDGSAAARAGDRDAWHERLKHPASRRGGDRCFALEGRRARDVYGETIGARLAKLDGVYFVYEPRIELADGAMFLEYRVARQGGEARLRLVVDRKHELLRVHAPRIELGWTASRLGQLLGSWVGEHEIDCSRAAVQSTDSDALAAFAAQALRDTVGRHLDHPPQPLDIDGARLLIVIEAVLADACLDACRLIYGSFASAAQRQRVIALGAMAWPGHALRLTSGQAKLEPSARDDEWRASLLQLRPGLADLDDPSLVSLRQEAGYLRHVDGRIERAVDDGSAELRASATFRWRPSVSERGARFISLEALDRPGHFILHRNFSYWLDRPKDQVERECATIVVREDSPPERRTPEAPAPFDIQRRPLRLSLRVLGLRDRFVGVVGDALTLAPCAHDRDRGAFSFEVVAGLSDRQKVSLRSVAFPGRYLCHERGRVVLREFTPGARAEHATFSWVPGHSETGERFFSLETLGHAPDRVMHRAGGFVIEKRATGVFGIASTFVIERPLLPARVLSRGALLTLGGLNRPDMVLTPEVGDYSTPEDVKLTGLDDGALGLVRDAASFRVVGGLADPDEISLESLEFPNHFLRHKNRVVLLERDDGSDQHHADATFRARPGLAEQGPRFVSLEAVNLPNNYLTCGSGFALTELRAVEDRVAATLVVGRPEPGRLHAPRAPAAFSLEFASPGQRVSLQVFGRRAQHLVAAPDQAARLGPAHGTPELATFRVMPGLADPQKVSFESVAHPGHYLAHYNFVLRLRRFDDTPLFRGDATFELTDDVGERCECYTALRSHNCPDKYLQYTGGEFRVAAAGEGAAGMNAVFVPVPPLSHPPRVFLRAGADPQARYLRGGRGRAQLVTAVTDQELRAAAFARVPGLSDPAKVSFESVQNPGRFLRHRGFKLYCDAYDGTRLFREDATFTRVPGLASRGAKLASFASANFDKRVLQRRGELLVLEQALDDEAKAAATFVVEEASEPLKP